LALNQEPAYLFWGLRCGALLEKGCRERKEKEEGKIAREMSMRTDNFLVVGTQFEQRTFFSESGTDFGPWRVTTKVQGCLINKQKIYPVVVVVVTVLSHMTLHNYIRELSPIDSKQELQIIEDEGRVHFEFWAPPLIMPCLRLLGCTRPTPTLLCCFLCVWFMFCFIVLVSVREGKAMGVA
jgi:hypothetical protein